MNSAQFGGSCGRCVRVRGTESGASGKSFLVMIVDECPTCSRGDIDFSTTALEAITGEFTCLPSAAPCWDFPALPEGLRPVRARHGLSWGGYGRFWRLRPTLCSRSARVLCPCLPAACLLPPAPHSDLAPFPPSPYPGFSWDRKRISWEWADCNGPTDARSNDSEDSNNNNKDESDSNDKQDKQEEQSECRRRYRHNRRAAGSGLAAA